jgi:hypothetical protein
VPNTRIGEIKKGFYEFQYTRELFEPSPPPGNRTGLLRLFLEVVLNRGLQKDRGLVVMNLNQGLNLLLQLLA